MRFGGAQHKRCSSNTSKNDALAQRSSWRMAAHVCKVLLNHGRHGRLLENRRSRRRINDHACDSRFCFSVMLRMDFPSSRRRSWRIKPGSQNKHVDLSRQTQQLLAGNINARDPYLSKQKHDALIENAHCALRSRAHFAPPMEHGRRGISKRPACSL